MNAFTCSGTSTVCFFLACVLASGCAAEGAETFEEVEQTDAEINGGGISEVTITVKQPLTAPPPPAGECAWSGTWTLNFETGRLYGDGCRRLGRAGKTDRIMSSEPYGRGELASFKEMVRSLRRSRRPSTCPADGPLVTLDVVKHGRVFSYVDVSTSCNSTATPLNYFDIQGLAMAMQ